MSNENHTERLEQCLIEIEALRTPGNPAKQISTLLELGQAVNNLLTSILQEKDISKEE